jgi:hypothetical protein
MKKIFTLSTFVIAISIFLTSCVKEDPFNEGYWLSKERAEVVFSSSSCPYYIVQTNLGYTIAASNSKPVVGEVLYGDFSYYGVKDVYNRTEGIIISSDVKEYGLSYNGAQDALDYYCY